MDKSRAWHWSKRELYPKHCFKRAPGLVVLSLRVRRLEVGQDEAGRWGWRVHLGEPVFPNCLSRRRSIKRSSARWLKRSNEWKIWHYITWWMNEWNNLTNLRIFGIFLFIENWSKKCDLAEFQKNRRLVSDWDKREKNLQHITLFVDIGGPSFSS